MIALRELPAPKDRSGVRRILGAFGYFRRFVPEFARIVGPITDLTRNNVPFEWTELQQDAFNLTNQELLANATITHFQYGAETLLKTDASKEGIAGILLQRIDGQWKICCCTSRRLSKAELNYSITELEGLAIVHAVHKFRHYLLGRPFTILTDHCALCSLTKKLSTNVRLRRWALFLRDHDIKMVHTKGSLHQDVDCPSRAPVNNEPDDFLDKLFSTKLDGLGTHSTMKSQRSL